MNSNNKVQNEKEKNIKKGDNIEKNGNKEIIENKNIKYISYGKRLSRLSVFTIIFVFIALISFIKIFDYIRSNKERFSENSVSNYSVCLEENDYYGQKCLEENMEYLSTLANYITYIFTYNALYDNYVDKKYIYYVDGNLKIYNQDNTSQVLYQKKYNFFEKRKFENKNNVFTISDSVNIDYKEIHKLVVDYNNKYSLLSNAVLTINFHVNDKIVSTLEMPIGKQTFTITKNDTTNNKTIDKDLKDNITKEFIILIFIFITSILASIFNIIKMILFLKKYRVKPNKYKNMINDILRNYDRIIVEVDDVSSILEDKKVLQIKDFLELVDVRDTIDKPILHLKINEIKHAFYVQDEEKVYELILKESNFENKE